MKRRAFIRLLGGAVVAQPIAALAQQPAMPVIGVVSAASADAFKALVPAYRQGLAAAGYVEDRNLAVEYRWADGHYDRLPEIIAEYINRGVAVIVAFGLPAALSAKKMTATIPIVFLSGADPVQFGVVGSLNRPGGNLTGVSQFFGALGPKRLELLRELVPRAATTGVLVNPSNPNADGHLNEIKSAASALNQQIEVASASTEGEIEAAFTGFAARNAQALLVADDPFFSARADQLVALTARHRLPAVFYARLFPTAGGLISYGPDQIDTYRLTGLYTGRVLSGAKPADLPVLQPTKFELVINVKTARALSLTIPPSLLARADEVIE
ncbi:MAG: ABC transporter substrate-binding protein [Xanthobacteraceae bacterium]